MLVYRLWPEIGRRGDGTDLPGRARPHGERGQDAGHHQEQQAERADLVRRAEVVDVEHVAARHLLDLALERRRMGVLALRRRREEAGDHLAPDGRRRVRLRHAEHDDVPLQHSNPG